MKTRVIQDPEVLDPTSTTSPRKPSRMGRFVKRHPLAVFFVLAFALTWMTIPFDSFMAAGPLFAALIVTAIVDGKRGLRELWGRMTKWRVGAKWYAVAVAVPLGIAFVAGGLNLAFGASDSAFAELELSAIALLFAARLVIPVFAPVGEEPGWRGFALPRMLENRSPAVASLALGVIIAVWHAPLIWVGTEGLPPVFLLTTVAVTFWYTWLFCRTGGSVFITIVAHAAEGLIGAQLIGDNGWGGADETGFVILYTAAWCLAAIALVVFDRGVFGVRRSGTVEPSRRRGTTAIVAASAVAVLVLAGCNAEDRRELGEQDVIEVLQERVGDEIGDGDLDLTCSSELDKTGTVTASCTGTTRDGGEVSASFDGTADVDDDECSATLRVEIDGDEVVNEPDVRCFA